MNSRAVAFGGVGYGGRSIAFDGFVVPGSNAYPDIGERRATRVRESTRAVVAAASLRSVASRQSTREAFVMAAETKSVDVQESERAARVRSSLRTVRVIEDDREVDQ